MPISEINKIKITGHGKSRKVKCCYCSTIVNRSILPHIKSKHPRKWQEWRKEILTSYNAGLNPKQIMKQRFSISSQPLFTWAVIEKEIRKMIEEGYKVKLHVKNKIEKWKPDDPDLIKKLNKTTTWRFKKRGNWATHNGSYRGNWPPEIPRYFIEKYTQPNDTVFDGFIGGGTTLVECKLLGRNAIGYDINPYAVKLAKKQLRIIKKESKKQNHELLPSRIKVKKCDVKNLKSIQDGSIDLICTHPPYFNILRYTHAIEGDLSHIINVNKFLDEMSSIANEFFRILDQDKICVILIGDVNIKKKRYPLSYRIMKKFLDAGFTYVDTIIKEQYNDRSTAFYVNNVSDDFRRITHEYLFIFEKRA